MHFFLRMVAFLFWILKIKTQSKEMSEGTEGDGEKNDKVLRN